MLLHKIILTSMRKVLHDKFKYLFQPSLYSYLTDIKHKRMWMAVKVKENSHK